MLKSILSWLIRENFINLHQGKSFDNVFYVTMDGCIKPLGNIHLDTFQEDGVFLITCEKCSRIFDVSVKDLRNHPEHNVCCPDCPSEEKAITEFISLYRIPGDIYQELIKILS